MKYNTSTSASFLRRSSTFLLLVIALVAQSCYKESDIITPKDDVASLKKTQAITSSIVGDSILMSSAINTTLPTVPVPGAQGMEINIEWIEFNNTQPPATAATARFELTGPAHLVIPHVILRSAYGNPVGPANGFSFSIPSYLPIGTYQVTVTTDVPNTSLAHDTGDGLMYDEAQGTLNITQGQITQIGPILQGSNFGNGGNNTSFNYNNRGITLMWPEQGVNNPYTGEVRFTMQNVSTGVFYALAPPSDEFPQVGAPQLNGVNNKFDAEDFYARAIYDSRDLPTGDYILYLDKYGSPVAGGTSWYYSSLAFNVPY